MFQWRNCCQRLECIHEGYVSDSYYIIELGNKIIHQARRRVTIANYLIALLPPIGSACMCAPLLVGWLASWRSPHALPSHPQPLSWLFHNSPCLVLNTSFSCSCSLSMYLSISPFPSLILTCNLALVLVFARSSLQVATNLPPSARYNTSGRAFPDVSAQVQ